MSDTDWGGIVAAFGPVGGLAIAVIIALSRTDFLKRDDGVMRKLDSLSDKIDAGRKENEAEFRGVRDRLTTVETISKEQARRLDRLER